MTLRHQVEDILGEIKLLPPERRKALKDLRDRAVHPTTEGDKLDTSLSHDAKDALVNIHVALEDLRAQINRLKEAL